MPFERASLQEIVNRIIVDYETRITGATSFLRRSVLNIMSKMTAGAVHLLYGFIDYQGRQLFVTTADEAGLETHASEWGVPRNDASKSIGIATGTGTNGITIPADTELQSTDDQVYLVDDDVTVAGGVFSLDLTAKVAGADGDDDAGISLTFVSPIAGVDSTVTVDSDGLSGGADIETDSALKVRILARKRQTPHGGADFDYEDWSLEVSGNTRAWSFPQYQGVGTIAVAYVRDNDSSIIPNATLRAVTRAYIVSHTDPATGKIVGCPVTAEPGLFIIELEELSVDLTIAIYPNTTAVQATITANLSDLILRDGGPGETLYLSKISEAISLASGEARHSLTSPVADVTAATNQVHTLGTITFTELS